MAHRSRFDRTDLERDEDARSRPRAPAARHPLLALQTAAGNRAVSRMVSQRRLMRKTTVTFMEIGSTESVEFDEKVHTEDQVAETWSAIRGFGVKLSSARALALYKAHYEKQGTPVAQLAQLRAAPWKYEDLMGLEQALRIARSIGAFLDTQTGVLAADTKDGLVLGKIAGVIDGKRFHAGAGAEAETVLPAGEKERAAIVFNATCGFINPPTDIEGNVFLPNPGSISTKYEVVEAARLDWEAKNRRAVWVHELGHTIYPRFQDAWVADVRLPRRLTDAYAEARKRYSPERVPEQPNEQLPTKYVQRKNNDEEDFCESFMVWTLFDRTKLSPLRQACFATRPDLNVTPPAPAALPEAAKT